MRTPETHYFEHGYIKFRKDKGLLKYFVYKYDEQGNNVYTTDSGFVENEDQLNKLISIPRHSLGLVKT